MRLIHLLLVFLIFLGASSLQAQVQKGDNNIGFSSSINTQSGSPQNINLTGLVSYERYFTDRLSLGVGPSGAILTSKGSLTANYGINVFGNFYFFTSGGKLLPYLGILGSLNQSISTADTRNAVSNNTVVESGNRTVSFYGAGAKAGVKYFFTERINLDVNLNYSTNLNAKVNNQLINLGSGGIIQLFAGIGVILAKRGN